MTKNSECLNRILAELTQIKTDLKDLNIIKKEVSEIRQIKADLKDLNIIKKEVSEISNIKKILVGNDWKGGLCGEVNALKTAKTIFMWILGINFMLLAGLVAVIF